MTDRPVLTLIATVLDAPDARELAGFYSRLLGWPIRTDEPDWVTARPTAVWGCRFRPRAPTSDPPGRRVQMISR